MLALPKGAPATLSVLGFVFQEAPRPPAQPKPKPAPQPAAPPPQAQPPAPQPSQPEQPCAGREDGTPTAEGSGRGEEGPGGGGGSGGRRVVGPAMPSAAMLAAAAEAALHAPARDTAGPGGEDEEEEVEGVRDARTSDDDSADDLMVGPAPPELVEEAEGAAEGTREAEVRAARGAGAARGP